MNKKIVVISTIILVIIAGSFAWRYASKNKLGSGDGQRSQAQEALFPLINGVLVKEEASNMRPIALIIENHPDSRPQSGLSAADVVYETLAEGGITRFLALYQGASQVSIGPVRSARPYFAEIASEYAAVFAHVGGSDEVLAKLAEKKYAGVDDANQYYLGDYFSRIKSRPAPHNVYTDLNKLHSLLKDRSWQNSSTVALWKFSDTVPSTAEPANQVTINFSTGSYRARFDFDPASGTYKRFLGGVPHADNETGKQIEPQTVVVQVARVADVPSDPKLRVDIDLDSGGHAYVFHGGSVTHAEWKKSQNRTRFYGVDGQEIQFARGQVWVAIVPEDNGAVTWK